ncbi:MAG: secretion system protein [Chloroflexi bacterium]|nr:MAG: secretion system protein [Chloroflexota bacterium]
MTAALATGTIAALSVIIMFVGVLRLVEREMDPQERLEAQLTERQRRARGKATETGRLLIIDRLDEAISRRDFSDDLARELLQADLKITVAEYILIRAAVVLVAFLVGVMVTRNPIVGVVLGGAGFFLPRLYIRYRRHKRLQAFDSQLEDVLTLLVGALRAGHSFLQALNVVVEEIPPPAADEFRRVVREVGLGLSLREALQNLVRRIESDDLDLIVTAVSIQQEVGGDLAEILDTISETIRERVRILGEIRVLTTRQKQTGYILAGLPVILGIIIYFLNPEYILPLFQRGPILAIPGFAAFMEVIGFMVIRKIVDIEV